MKSMLNQDVAKVLISEEEIRTRVQELGDQLYERFADKDPIFVSVLRGSFIFMADLVRACQIRSDVEFISVSSYGTGVRSSSGHVRMPSFDRCGRYPGFGEYAVLFEGLFPDEGSGGCDHCYTAGQALPSAKGDPAGLYGLCYSG